MPGRKLTKEQEDKFNEISQEWREEVDRIFEAYKDAEPNTGRLDGPETYELAQTQLKYKRKINEALGMDFYEDVGKVEKGGHRKFSDLIVPNPHGFPELPK